MNEKPKEKWERRIKEIDRAIDMHEVKIANLNKEKEILKQKLEKENPNHQAPQE